MEYCYLFNNYNYFDIMRPKHTKNKRKWVVSILLVFLLIWFVDAKVGGNLKDKFLESKEKITQKVENYNISIQQDPLIAKCIDSFDRCKYIATRKYDVSFKILEIRRFDDEEKAEEYFNIWKGPAQSDLIKELKEKGYYTTVEESLPLVMFFLKVKSWIGEMPRVTICDSDGELLSKSSLLCG